MANPNPLPPPAEHRFKPGQSGNPGGKNGSRKQLEKEFIEDMLATWKAGGKAAIEKVMKTRPQDYLKVAASLMPKQLNVTDESAGDRERTARLLELVSRRLEDIAETPAIPVGADRLREPVTAVSPLSKAN